MTIPNVPAYAEAASAMLGLEIASAHRPGVEMNLRLAARMMELVEGMALTPADEPAPVFVAARGAENATGRAA